MYDPEITLNTSQMMNYMSPGSLRRPTLKTGVGNTHGTGEMPLDLTDMLMDVRTC